MTTEALAVTKFQKRFDELNPILKANSAKIVRLQEELGGCFALMLRSLRDMDLAFRQKPPNIALRDGDVEYRDFDAWADDYGKPIIGFKKRQLYYALHVGKNLVDKVTDEDLEAM